MRGVLENCISMYTNLGSLKLGAFTAFTMGTSTARGVTHNSIKMPDKAGQGSLYQTKQGKATKNQGRTYSAQCPLSCECTHQIIHSVLERPCKCFIL